MPKRQPAWWQRPTASSISHCLYPQNANGHSNAKEQGERIERRILSILTNCPCINSLVYFTKMVAYKIILLGCYPDLWEGFMQVSSQSLSFLSFKINVFLCQRSSERSWVEIQIWNLHYTHDRHNYESGWDNRMWI